MGQRGYSAEQIVNKLREAEVLLSQGTPVKQVCGLSVSDRSARTMSGATTSCTTERRTGGRSVCSW